MRKVLFFFGILNDNDIEWLARNGERKEIAAGDVLIEEGKSIDYMFLLMDGALRVTTKATLGRELARLSSGELVGELSFVDSRPPSASVTAVDRSTVLSISRTKLKERLKSDVAFGSRFYFALATFLADRLRATNSQLGNGKSREEVEDRDGLGIETLDNLSLAGTRFDNLRQRMLG